MNAKVYCLASPKGGSGKTILTATFASFLTAIGKKCLIVDCDAATHGLTLLYLHDVNKKIQLNNQNRPNGTLDCRKIDLNKDIVTVENGVDLLPATYKFELYECLDAENYSLTLKYILSIAKENYDYIFFDAQAGSDSISHAAMKKDISDEVIIVSEYDPLSAAGVERLKSIFNNDLDFTRTWVLLNKMLPEFVDKFSDFLSVTKYLSPIPWTADVVRAYSRRKLALDIEFGNEYTIAIMQTLKSLLGEEAEIEINKWSEDRAYKIRMPLETQYLDAEKELFSLLQAKKDVARKKEINNLKFTALVPLSAIMAMYLLYIFDKKTLLSNIFPIIEPLMYITLASTFLIAFVILYKPKILVRPYDAKKEIEEARLDRQYEVVVERLKKLEALKSADYKTLIKNS